MLPVVCSMNLPENGVHSFENSNHELQVTSAQNVAAEKIRNQLLKGMGLKAMPKKRHVSLPSRH